MSEKVLGVDGVLRSLEVERELNSQFALVFNSPAGERVRAYLRSITVNVTNGPAVSDAALRHHAGMCNLAAIIEQRIEHGRERPDHSAAGARRRRKPAAAPG